MKRMRLFLAGGILWLCLQGAVFAESVEIQIADVPPEAEAVQLLFSEEEAAACVHQGAYWNAHSVPDETEISGLSIHWGEGYVTKIPRSVLVFGAEEQEPVQRLFVPKTLQLVTCTVHHRYFLQTENEKLPEGEVLETLGTYVGASASDVVVRRLEYADNVYTGGELRADEEIETATVITLDYVRTLNALTPVTPAPSASEPTPEPLPEEAPPEPSPSSAPPSISAEEPQGSVSFNSAQSDVQSEPPYRTPRPAPATESGEESDPGTGDTQVLTGYWVAAAFAAALLAGLWMLRQRKKRFAGENTENPAQKTDDAENKEN